MLHAWLTDAGPLPLANHCRLTTTGSLLLANHRRLTAHLQERLHDPSRCACAAPRPAR